MVETALNGSCAHDGSPQVIRSRVNVNAFFIPRSDYKMFVFFMLRRSLNGVPSASKQKSFTGPHLSLAKIPCYSPII